MAASFAVRNKKQAITWERELFSKIAKLKTFGEFIEDMSGKFILSHERCTLALEWYQTHRHTDKYRQTTVNLVRMHAER